jgi:elongation factor Tu
LVNRIVVFFFFLLVVLSLTVTGSVAEYKFERTKPHVNVGVIGQEGHGGAELTSAITKVLSGKGGAKFISVTEIKQAPEEKERGITIATSYVEYETENRHYAHVYFPKSIDYIKNAITGAAYMDGAILVISSKDGPTSQTEEYLRLARITGVKAIVVYLNVVSDNQTGQQLSSIENKIRTLLSSHGYSGDATPVIIGFSEAEPTQADKKVRKQAILALLKAMDSHIPVPPRSRYLPFLMPIDDVYSVSGRGTVVTGRVERGTIRVGEEVEIVGILPPYKTVCTGVEMFRRLVDEGQAGDYIGVFLKDAKRNEIGRGQVIAMPGTATPHTKFRAEIYVLSKEEGGRYAPFFSGYRPQFFFRTTDVTGVLTLPKRVAMVMPGDTVTIEAELITPIAMEKGLRFAIREGGRTVGAGVVIDMIE